MIQRHEKAHAVAMMCRMLEVSRSGYYDWRTRPPSARAQANQRLTDDIRRIHQEHKGRVGAPRITRHLHEEGQCVGKNRVAGLMHANGLRAKAARKYKATTNSNHTLPVAPNLLEQDFTAQAPNQKWVSDITYIATDEGWLYLAVVLDVFSRKVVGWALDRTLANRLTITALERAVAQRQPRPGLVHHSDRGLQYARGEYVAILEQYGIVPSMSRPANPYDNASCESFMKTLKREEIYANRYDNLEDLRANIAEFIEQYYNRQRLHSALGYRSPEEFERQIAQENSADSRGATVEFVVHNENSENEERDSKKLAGDEDSNAVLFPRPLLLLQDATKDQ